MQRDKEEGIPIICRTCQKYFLFKYRCSINQFLSIVVIIKVIDWVLEEGAPILIGQPTHAPRDFDIWTINTKDPYHHNIQNTKNNDACRTRTCNLYHRKVVRYHCDNAPRIALKPSYLMI